MTPLENSLNTIKLNGVEYEMQIVEATEKGCTIAAYEDKPPHDWQYPEWENKSRVHNWRNYVSEELQAMWDTFTDVQKKALAISYDDIASQEDWE